VIARTRSIIESDDPADTLLVVLGRGVMKQRDRAGACVPASPRRWRACAHRIAALAAVLALAPGLALAQGARDVPDELVVQMHPTARGGPDRQLLQEAGAEPLDEIPDRGLFRVRVPRGARNAVHSALERHPDVIFVERHRLFPPAVVPDDPRFDLQWHHDTLGSPVAWDRTLAVGRIIAILDSGVKPDHPDLAPALLPGWDFWDDDDDPSDPFGHGTRVAGLAAAATGNATGIAGMAWGAAILPVRVADESGWASSWSIVEGLEYAAAQGARVANLSFGQLAGSQTVLAAAQAAVEAGVVVVASAGNCGCTESFPDTPWLLSVGATTSSDGLAGFSSRGDFVDLAAPGASVQTTSPSGSYENGWGTSFSAPLVSGLVALLQAAKPAMTPAQVEQRLEDTAVDLGATGWDPGFGHGRIDAAAALDFGSSPACGLGPGLALVLPGLLAARRARRAPGGRTADPRGRRAAA
jgi:subtilisin family serine protease